MQPQSGIVTVLDLLFPPGTATALSSAATPAMALRPAEALGASAFAPRRELEFRHGRYCAHAALARLGITAAQGIAVGLQREPLWPPGVVGSITHADRWAAAAVARSVTAESIGLDLEPATELEPELVALVCRADEIAQLPALPAAARLLAKQLFCAKEAVYKALWPLQRVFLEFQDVGIRLRADGRGFAACVRGREAPLPGMGRITGQLLENEGFFAAGVAITREQPGVSG